MVSYKKRINDELSNGINSFEKSIQYAEIYPFVQDLINELIYKAHEIKEIVNGSDEPLPKGQTCIKESMEGN